MLAIAKGEGVEAYFNLGDTFETQEAVKTKFSDIFYKFCKAVDKPHYIIVGNHDCPQKLNTKINAMTVFGEIDNTCIIDELSYVDLAGKRFILQPYTEEIDQVKMKSFLSDQNILLAHVSIQGARMNSVKKASSGVNVNFSDFEACYFGHFHTRQQVKDNAWYIGSLTQQNWNLADQPTGFGIYDTNTGEIKFYDLGSIKHKLITDSSQLTEDEIKGHCIKLKLNDKFSPALRDRLIQDLRDKGALDVKLDFNMEAKDDRIVKLEDQIHTTGDYMKAIIEDSDTELDKDFLLECGLECLQNSGDVNA